MTRPLSCLRLSLAFALTGMLFACAPTPSYAPPQGIHAERPGGRTTGAKHGDESAPGATPPAAVVNARTVKVGLLLPLTGRNASLGRAMQDAATISLFDKYAHLSPTLASIRVELLPKDTGDTPEQAAGAMKRALDDGAEFIIGPIFSESTQAAAPIAMAKGIGVLSLSNNQDLAKPGVYMFGFSPVEQTQRILAYALRQGHVRIAALVPDSVLGDTVLSTARETLANSGVELAASAKYAAQGVGIDRAISTLVPPGTTPDFDALLLPEGGPSLGTILRALAQHGIKQPQVQFLGTGIWDDATLVRRVNLDGAWLASSPPETTSLFEKRFVGNYKYTPPRVASLSYDAVALAVTLATSDRGFGPSALTGSTGFSGPANGIFRLHGNGQTERGLAVLAISGGGFTVLDPAPGSFSSPTTGR